jgi:hypothetical protein
MTESREEEQEIKGVIPPYYSLIIGILQGIYEAWDREDYITALKRSLRIVTFLPNKLKIQLKEEKSNIQKALEKSRNVNQYTYASTRRAITNALNYTSEKFLDYWVDKITSLMDKEHILTEGYGIPTISHSMQDFQMTVDRARYRKEQEAEE